MPIALPTVDGMNAHEVVPIPSHDVPRLRIGSAADTAAVIPYLLGYHPRESIVVLVSDQRRVALTARFPFEIIDHPKELQYRMSQITGQHPYAQWVLVGYSKDREHAEAHIDRLISYLDTVDEADVIDALVVSQGRLWSLMCRNELCCSPQGEPYDAFSSPIAVEAIVNGLQAVPDRDDLKARVRPPRGWAARAATERIEDAFELLRQCGFDEAEELFNELLDRGLDDPEDLDDYELAQLAALAFFPALRDVALRRIHRCDAHRHVSLWQRTTQATPKAYQASVLAVLGLASWVSGDGAMQMICLERGEQIAPGHSLLALLDEINRMAAPPTLWEKVLADLPRPLPTVGLP